jgi:hypothetical protein
MKRLLIILVLVVVFWLAMAIPVMADAVNPPDTRGGRIIGPFELPVELPEQAIDHSPVLQGGMNT